MGAAAATHADRVIVTDDNPRSEDPATIRAAVLAGAYGAQGAHGSTRQPERIREIGDRGAAIREAVARAGAGDTVVVLGKGHESGQETAGVVHPFDDRAQLRAALMEHTAPMDQPAPSSQPAPGDRPASGERR
jgi:UDP-N-acetylmuramoyl-L-alanyl-D-glutamate--2,6-diaminopimelate ligase